MGKLIFRTTKPKKGYTDYQSFSTHKVDYPEKLPPFESEGLDKVNEIMSKALRELDAIGYDFTNAYFSIGLK